METETEIVEFVIGTILLVAIMFVSGYLIYRYVKAILKQ